MAKLIRKCRLADSSHRDVDLRIYEDIIIETINKTVMVQKMSSHNGRIFFMFYHLLQGEMYWAGIPYVDGSTLKNA